MVNITEIAAKSILNIMAQRGLDDTIFALDLRVIRGACGVSFTKDIDGILKDFHGLRVNIDPLVMKGDDLYVDFGEVDGKQGIIFKGGLNAN